MKLKFKEQDYQLDAVKAVCDLFEGQKIKDSVFTVTNPTNIPFAVPETTVANHLTLSDEQILENMHCVQENHQLMTTDDLKGRQFSIEMETGTGKTYVYTRTILELNKKYGFNKFIIVVPSVAIREGVYKSLQVTYDHFATIYNKVPYHYFIYNSTNVPVVRTFAQSTNIEIMIINIDAFKKAENIINQQIDRLNGDAAIDYIKKTNPIVIIDEPQSVDNTDKAKEAIATLNPLCVLRYSATHREKINLLYRLTPIDAFENGLVKQIYVQSIKSDANHNLPYVKVLDVAHDNGYSGHIEIDVRAKNGLVKRKTVTVKQGSDLEKLSGDRDCYKGYVVTNFECAKGQEYIELSNDRKIALGTAIGDLDELTAKRTQIRMTIEEHLNKELSYIKQGIKVLSLFFIDEVKKYRTPDGQKGIYTKIFEEEYTNLINKTKYSEIKKVFKQDAEQVHNGYFSQDKKGLKDTKGNTLADYSTYNLIMKDKETLLSFECPLRFIFSHSALKEGWDNPNVFQICTLLDQKSTFTARQKIGRGLRLCVNKDGDRIEDPNINILHVMANESYAEFADNLQKELEDETGIKFGFLEQSIFSGLRFEHKLVVTRELNKEEQKLLQTDLKLEGFNVEGAESAEVPEITPTSDESVKPKVEEVKPKPKLTQALQNTKTQLIENLSKERTITENEIEKLTVTETVVEQKTISSEDSLKIHQQLQDKGYLSKEGKITNKFTKAIDDGSFELSDGFEGAKDLVIEVVRKHNTKPPLRDASKNVRVKLKKQVMLSPEFKELWDQIKQKTIFKIHIDEDTLVRNCIKAIVNMDPIPKPKISAYTAKVEVKQSGVESDENKVVGKTYELNTAYLSLPNLITEVSEQTLTKRQTIYEILTQSNRLEDFLNNPQRYIETVVGLINNERQALAVDGITYKKRDDGSVYYEQEIFDCDDILANLDRNAVPVDHSVYDHVIYDSQTIEKNFALALDSDPDVKMFFKLPNKFKVDTPIGSYNPDWAVYVSTDHFKKLYLVVETKGGTDVLRNLRGSERMKIECGKKHFAAIQSELRLAKDWLSLKQNL